MAKGRGSAMMATMVLCLVAVMVQCEAATYVVGDDNGWTFNVDGWEKGKNFNAGDVLVFKYAKGSHNVVAVDEGGYYGCDVSPYDAKVYTSGNDQITLVKGNNSFICSFSDHCNSGMRLLISAS
ncbi:putative Phytocyanin domain, cupredoxin [Helianthus debilis subsp. tardiflorus]